MRSATPRVGRLGKSHPERVPDKGTLPRCACDPLRVDAVVNAPLDALERIMNDDEIKNTIQEQVKLEVNRLLRTSSWVLFAIACAMLLNQFESMFSTLPQFEQMFKEMDIGELPASTRVLFYCARYALPLCGMVFLIAVICHCKRSLGGLFALCGLIMLVREFTVHALFMPLISIMDRLNTK